MLKCIYIDLFPYIIDDLKLSSIIWTKVKNNPKIIEWLKDKPKMVELIDDNPAFFKNANLFEELLSPNDYKFFYDYWKLEFRDNLFALAKNGLNPIINDFFKNCYENNVKMIVTYNRDVCDNIGQLYPFLKNVDFKYISYEKSLNLEGFVKLNLENEFLISEVCVMTQKPEVLEHLQSSNFFVTTINSTKLNSNDKNIHYFNNYKNLSYYDLSYSFYKDEDEDTMEL